MISLSFPPTFLFFLSGCHSFFLLWFHEFYSLQLALFAWSGLVLDVFVAKWIVPYFEFFWFFSFATSRTGCLHSLFLFFHSFFMSMCVLLWFPCQFVWGDVWGWFPFPNSQLSVVSFSPLSFAALTIFLFWWIPICIWGLTEWAGRCVLMSPLEITVTCHRSRLLLLPASPMHSMMWQRACHCSSTLLWWVYHWCVFQYY